MKTKKAKVVDAPGINERTEKIQKLKKNSIMTNILISLILVPIICITVNCLFDIPMLIYYTSFVIVNVIISVGFVGYYFDVKIDKQISQLIEFINKTQSNKKKCKKIYGQKKPNKIS